MLKIYGDLTKFGIVIFVILAGLAGYATGFESAQPLDFHHFFWAMVGLYLLSSGSLALNQVQEWKLDQKMNRTAKRPIASGRLKPLAGLILAISFLFAGLQLLYASSSTAGWVSLVSVLLYNGIYTMYWKKKWVFAAVPGAIPGALPVTIGYAAANPNIFSSDSIYLFLIMFLWQMPHFWVLAMKYKEDYMRGGIPVLPAVLGNERALFHIGLYTFVYVGVAMASPWMVHAHWMYLFVVAPMSAILLYWFFKFYKAKGEKHWFGFFMWTNMSMLVFIMVPVIDKWSFLLNN